MGRVVTIVAVDPHKPSPAADEGDSGIRGVMTTLGKLHSSEYFLGRASVIQEIPKILAQAAVGRTDKPELIQIIGHGESGILSLGGHWTQQRTAKTAGGGIVHYILDSDPYAYQVLLHSVAPPTKVWLLGCQVGGSLPGSTVADGPTLLFNLAQLWSCEVSAPVVSVNPLEDFDGGGRYRYPDERMIHAKDRCVSPNPAPTWPAQASAGTGGEGARVRGQVK